MRSTFYSLLIATLLLTGCVKKASGPADFLIGDITPITIPTVFMHKPGNLPRTTMEKISLIGEKQEHTKVDLSARTEQKGDKLLLTINMLKISSDETTYEQDIPFCVIKAHFTPSGILSNTMLTFPALERDGEQISHKSDLYRSTKKSILKSMSELRTDKLVSGDKLYFLPPETFEKLTPLGPSPQIGPTIQGYTDFQGKKMVLTRINYSDLEFKLKNSGIKVYIDIQGYEMFDAETMFMVKGKTVVTVKPVDYSQVIVETLVYPAVN